MVVILKRLGTGMVNESKGVGNKSHLFAMNVI